MTTQSEPGDGRLDPALSAIMSERRQLLNLAYRLLGSLAGAEDVVQETYARWYAMSRQQQHAIESPGAWLTKVASRIPRPARLGTGPAGELRGRMDPRAAARTYGMDQRTVSWRPGRPGRPGHPRRVDQHGLPRRARVDDPGRTRRVHPPRRLPLPLHRNRRDRRPTPAACRQLASSARRRIRAAHAPATPASRQARIVRDLKLAWEAKDIDALIGLLDPDATATGDGGGLVATALRPVEGAEQIVRSLVRLQSRLRNLTILERTVNGQPGLIAQQDGVTVSVFAFDIAADRIKHIWAVCNPEKLRPWTVGPHTV
jgi:hypothetical protein